MVLQVSLNEISYGLAFHPHFATDAPSPPYDNAGNLDAIRHMVKMEKKSFTSDFVIDRKARKDDVSVHFLDEGIRLVNF